MFVVPSGHAFRACRLDVSTSRIDPGRAALTAHRIFPIESPVVQDCLFASSRSCQRFFSWLVGGLRLWGHDFIGPAEETLCAAVRFEVDMSSK